MATRYHLLPSAVLAKSDTLDLLVMDCAMTWHREQTEMVQAKSEGRPRATNIPVNKLQEMIDKVKKNADKDNKKLHESQH